MVSSDQKIFTPVYVAEPSEPLFIQNFPEAQAPIGTPKKTSVKFDSYCPGAMLAESVFVAQQVGSPTFSNGVASFSDKESESDCSTTDTAHEAKQLASPDGAGYMIPNLAMMGDNSWQMYWPMPYPLPLQAQPDQTWTQPMPRARADTWSQPMPGAVVSGGSTGHRLGRCKPCAFMYKDGCRSGADCPYCHLCPPGEKQRRKRVMRSMQRHITE